MASRCVKCGGEHQPKDCNNITKDNKREDLKCANCNEHGHPANYRGCAYYKTALNILKKRKLLNNKPNPHSEVTNAPKRNFVSKTVNKNVSYAQTANNQRPSQNNQSYNTPRQTRNIPQYKTLEPSRKESTESPPPWVEQLRNDILFHVSEMIKDVRRELHARMDSMISEMNIYEA